jgi:hypothetical protein
MSIFKTTLHDNSPNELLSRFGILACDMDNIIYAYRPDGTTYTVAGFDYKHNGIVGEYKTKQNSRPSALYLKRSCFSYMGDLCTRENAGFYCIITYTKPTEQDYQMLFIIPVNAVAIGQFNSFRNNSRKNRDFWFSPKEWGLFCRKLSGKNNQLPETDERGNLNFISDVKIRYELPAIYCQKECGNCVYCNMHKINNSLPMDIIQ